MPFGFGGTIKTSIIKASNNGQSDVELPGKFIDLLSMISDLWVGLTKSLAEGLFGRCSSTFRRQFLMLMIFMLPFKPVACPS